MTKNILKTLEFIKEKFQPGIAGGRLTYRYDHTLRVAAVGQQIAAAEGLNEEALVLGCLLHDIGYIECKTDEDFKFHGRISGRLARSYLESIGYDKEWIDTICYGIIYHTEEPDRKLTVFEESISDADNIDRFDVYRLYEGLKHHKLEELRPGEMAELSEKQVCRLKELIDFPAATATAKNLWQDRLRFMSSYFERLYAQMTAGLI